MEDATQQLQEGLEDVNLSLGFLLLIVAAILLSLWALVIQRGGLCLTLQGERPTNLPPIFPVRCRSSAMVVGSLGFFLCLALKTYWQANQGTDPVARCSASSNLFSAVLVLSAAVLRWEDLHYVEACRPAKVAEETLPD